ncbi:MAG: phosphoribosyl transferase, partial [Phototrophicales bacterium]
MTNQILSNRRDAGKRLATKLLNYSNDDNTVVLALPRGGVPVAFEIAQKLNLSLDVCIVRKLGAPGNRELAIGAIALDQSLILHQDWLKQHKITSAQVKQIIEQEQQELIRRDRLYRQGTSRRSLEGCQVILVDDGIATGATIRAAIALIQQQQPQSLILAVPVLPLELVKTLQQEVDQLVYL